MPRILQNMIVACFLLAAGPSASFCQTGHILTVKVLDARNSKPLRHIRLWLGWSKGSQSPSAETNDAGTAVFHLPDPLPDGRPWLSCRFVVICSGSRVSIDQVLARGTVAENNRGKAKLSGNPSPGELVIFARRLSVFQRIRDVLD
jgi:hypothetical protein